VQELRLWGRGKSLHPMHIHVNHFQVAEFFDDAPRAISTSKYYGEVGDWRDTWPAMPAHSALRTVYMNFVGEYVVPCHFLVHEDMGMMTTVYIEAAPPTEVPTAEPSVAPTASVSPSAAPSQRLHVAVRRGIAA
jgi:FtsP/CotA-like multicopper oxidase with cupredoxin domain